MKLTNRKGRLSTTNLRKLQRRIERLDSNEVFGTLETTVGLMVSYIPEYRKLKRPELLAEMRLSAEYVYACADALVRRTEPGVPEDPIPAPQSARQLKRDLY